MTPIRQRAKSEQSPACAQACWSLLQRKCACGNGTTSGAECETCRVNRLKFPHRAEVQSEQLEVPAIVGEVLACPGQALDLGTLAFMEPRFRHDFSHVRVHADAKAAQAAQAVNALAYTAGRHVVFGSAQYSPTTMAGRQLIAHELTHVVQQGDSCRQPTLRVGTGDDPAEVEAERAARTIEAPADLAYASGGISKVSRNAIRRRVRPENVTCNRTGLRNPNLTGEEAVAAITSADAEAVHLAQAAERTLTEQLAAARAGDPIDAGLDTILLEELGLSLNNHAHFGLVQQQINRFHRVHETLASGYLHYMCRGGDVVRLVGCTPGPCGEDFAQSCPGNRLIVLCQAFWDTPEEQSATILHEPFHIWFHMARHVANALRRADADCFESYALRVSGRSAFASCVDHTAG
jgi:hypothetical protein